MHYFEIGVVTSSTRAAGGEFVPSGRLMYVIPDEAQELAEPILAPYGQDPMWYFDNLNFGRAPAPWAIVCLAREYAIAGHIAEARPPDAGIFFAPYTPVPSPVPDGFVPAVGVLIFQDKHGLERAAEHSPVFAAAWGALRTCSQERTWLAVMDPLDESWVADVLPNDREKWAASGGRPASLSGRETMELSRDGNPIRSVEEWFEHARPLGGVNQWRDGYSAKELAKAWCRVPGAPEVPADFAALLNRLPGFPNVRPVSGEPEYRVQFDGIISGPRNTDLALRCASDVGTVAVSVEAKSREPFGPPVYDVMGVAARNWCDEKASDYVERLEDLKRGLFWPREPGSPRIGELRYQLLTATAGALVYAGQVGAVAAMLVIHEFRPPRIATDRYADNARDLAQFVHRLAGTPPTPDHDLWGPFRVPGNAMVPGGMPLFIAKLVSPCDAVRPHPRPEPRQGRLPGPP